MLTDQLQAIPESDEGKHEAGANAPSDFREHLPEDLRSDPILSSYASVEALARSHIAAERMIGKRIEDASTEELGRYYARHGCPESPDKYDFNSPNEESPSVLENQARSWFHQAGLSQRQAEILHEKWSDYVAEHEQGALSESENRLAESEQALRAQWGRTYDRNVTMASRAVEQFGGPELADYLDETGLGNDPRLIKAFAAIAAQVGEDSLIGDGEGDFVITPDAAKGEITRTLGNPAYFDANHPDHGATVERMRELFAAAYPDIAKE